MPVITALKSMTAIEKFLCQQPTLSGLMTSNNRMSQTLTKADIQGALQKGY